MKNPFAMALFLCSMSRNFQSLETNAAQISNPWNLRSNFEEERTFHCEELSHSLSGQAAA